MVEVGILGRRDRVELPRAFATSSSCSMTRTEMTSMDEQIVETATGLGYVEIVEGTGTRPKAGDSVSVHYTGWLKSGQKFDSSHDRGQPLEFSVGRGQVIKGWDEGVGTMRVGGKRKLIIPAHLGYGDRGASGVIPPGATLIFEVELVGIRGE
jgi:peptidylprolyl isomerase